jgi:hypothetical protein
MLLSSARGSGPESGRASLEFLTAAIVLLIPVMSLAMSLSSIQNAALATEAAARNAARVFVQEPNLQIAAIRAEQAVMVALANHGFDAASILERSCSSAECVAPGTIVLIRVGVEAPLFSSPFLPGFLGEATIPVVSQASAMVSRFGGAP